MMEPPASYNPSRPRSPRSFGKSLETAFVVYGDAERLEAYSHDEVAEAHYAHMPEILVRPDGAEQIAAIVNSPTAAASPSRRAGRVGLSGGAVPLHGGIVLLCDRMNRIVEIDRENMMITVEAGVVTNEINEVLREAGLFYAGYPMSLETCFIGATWPRTPRGARPSSTA